MLKEKIVVIDGDAASNRDAGKAYFVQEMDAYRAEKWAMRAFFAIAQSGVDLGEVSKGGIVGLKVAGLQALMNMRFEAAEPLLDEMMDCISRVPDRKNPEIYRALRRDQNDIEEVSTLLRLRMEVLELHTGFTMADLARTTTSAESAATSPA